MGKLRVMSGAQVCRILREQGFESVRQRSSHVVMRKTFAQGHLTLPVPQHNPLKRGTLMSVIHLAQLPRE